MRALIVEDDADVAADLAAGLAQAGFTPECVADGEAAWYRGEVEDFDLAILDFGLPKLDGLSVLRRWRAADRRFPVLVLSARGDWSEKVEGIEAGADDYLAKPFQMAELAARARGLVRRAAGHPAPVIQCGALAIDTRRQMVQRDGRRLNLSALEFRLLDYLAHQGGRAVPAGELAEHLYGAAADGDTNAIEALIVRLRRKLGAAAIETRRGFGYRMADSGPAP